MASRARGWGVRSVISVRLPLQIGTTAARCLLRGGLLFVPGLGLTLVGIALWGACELEGDGVGEVIATILVGAPLALLYYGWQQLRWAWQARPSDVVLEREGIAIHGGRHAGRRFAWTSLGAEACRLEAPVASTSDPVDDERTLHRLILSSDGSDVVLAIAEQPGEVASLADVAATIRGAREACSTAPHEAAPARVETMTCRSCGAVAAPADAETVPCKFCDAVVVVPEPVRVQVRAAAHAADRPDAAVRALLRQPGAGFVGTVFFVGAMLAALAWPVAIGVVAHNVHERSATWTSTALLLLFVLALSVGIHSLLRVRLVDRTALRLVLLDFGAAAPRRSGEPYRCRQCNGPLPDRPGRVVIGCAFCEADNVLGLDLHREVAAVGEQRRSLRDALARRAAERRSLRGAGVLALGLLTVSVWSLRHGFLHNPRTWPLEQRCAAEDVDACVELAELLVAPSLEDVRRDVPRGAELLAGACDAGHAAACGRLAALHIEPLASFPGKSDEQAAALLRQACDGGVPEACYELGLLHRNGSFMARIDQDDATAAELYRRACDGGFALACTDLGFLYSNGKGVAADDASAFRYAEKGCALGSELGCNNLGTMYEHGRSVPRDLGQALVLYQRACDASIELGCNNLRRLGDAPASP